MFGKVPSRFTFCCAFAVTYYQRQDHCFWHLLSILYYPISCLDNWGHYITLFYMHQIVYHNYEIAFLLRNAFQTARKRVVGQDRKANQSCSNCLIAPTFFVRAFFQSADVDTQAILPEVEYTLSVSDP